MKQPPINVPAKLEKAEIRREVVAHVDCPVCQAEKQFSVAHILTDYDAGKACPNGYTWLCTECHHEIDFKFDDHGWLVCGPNGKRRDYDWVVLEITPETLKNTGRVFLVDGGLRKDNDTGARVPTSKPHPTSSNPRDHDYFFTEHSCNINTLRHAEEIIVVAPNGEVHNDPHGLFEVAGAVPWVRYQTEHGHLDFDGARGGETDLKAFLQDAGVLPRAMTPEECAAFIEENGPKLEAGEVIRLGAYVAYKERMAGAPMYTLEYGWSERWVASDRSSSALLDSMIAYYRDGAPK